MLIGTKRDVKAAEQPSDIAIIGLMSQTTAKNAKRSSMPKSSVGSTFVVRNLARVVALLLCIPRIGITFRITVRNAGRRETLGQVG